MTLKSKLEEAEKRESLLDMEGLGSRERLQDLLPEERVLFTWSDISASAPAAARPGCWSRGAAPQRRPVLSAVGGEARPGELLAILGSSGAGKTSLLNALLGRGGRGKQ